MNNRKHPIVWVIGATRSCKTPIAEHGVAPLGFELISTATYFRERYGQPDLFTKEFIFDLSEFSAGCLVEDPDCHRSHLEEIITDSPRPYVIEGERNPDEFAKLYDPKLDMVIFVSRVDMDKYDTLIERGIPVMEQYVRWCVSTGVAPPSSVIKLTFGGRDIKAEYFGKGYDADSVLIEGTAPERIPDALSVEDRYPWIDFVIKITVDAVKGYYRIKTPSIYDTPAPSP